MSTEAEELLGQLVEKLENLETKVQAIAKENGSLRNMVKLIYEQNYKLVREREEKIRKEEGRESIAEEGERISREIQARKHKRSQRTIQVFLE